MNGRRLSMFCICGGYGFPQELLITEKIELRVACICRDCNREFYSIFSLENLTANCPHSDQKFRGAVKPPLAQPLALPEAPIEEPKWSDYDRIFLEGEGIGGDL